jgi:hypothetical protein
MRTTEVLPPSLNQSQVGTPAHSRRAAAFRQVPCSTSEKRYEVLDAHRGLPEHRAERPRSELSVKRDDRSPASGVAELHMTAALADLHEASLE